MGMERDMCIDISGDMCIDISGDMCIDIRDMCINMSRAETFRRDHGEGGAAERAQGTQRGGREGLGGRDQAPGVAV